MQDNFFFREPSTQKKLLDILFIYSKLNPDTGYRQGMHELLAPILWVVDCDAVDPQSLHQGARGEEMENEEMMLDILDAAFVEHDAFNLFCAVMQTTKAFYEVGDSKTSPLVGRSRRIHEELLATVDPELEHHLGSIEILPQIYLMYVCATRSVVCR
jgi:TBC1 domain family protein 5